MEHHIRPLVRSHVLIIVGAFVVVGITLLGIMSNPGELIRRDVLMGPIIATGRVVVPLFLVIGAVYLLASIKKCRACGKILFWRKSSQH